MPITASWALHPRAKGSPFPVGAFEASGAAGPGEATGGSLLGLAPSTAVTSLDIFSTSANSFTLNPSVWVTTELSVRVTMTLRPDFARIQ